MTYCVILGSAFGAPTLGGAKLTPKSVKTRFGTVELFQYPDAKDGYALFRHGLPHKYLPNQIPYRANAEALKEIGCKALLITSSVGVLDPRLPLFTPMVGGDLLMTDNRLPDGGACTMFTEPTAGQGHLVIEDGIFSSALNQELERLADRPLSRVVFAYVGGPRTKTPAENRALRAQGAQVNSMTVGPEAVLAAELGIPVAALFVGHKHSGDHDADTPDVTSDLGASLTAARAATERLAEQFLRGVKVPPPGNRLFRFGS